MTFPVTRPRRLRTNETIRKMVCETHLSPDQFVYPLFVCPGEGVKKEITAMPGNYQWSVDTVIEEVALAKSLGIGGVILFGIPEKKDGRGKEAYDEQGVVQEAVRALKREIKDNLVITDVCLCEYTSHGHCGIVSGEEVRNDESVELLARAALHRAQGEFAQAQRDLEEALTIATRGGMRLHEADCYLESARLHLAQGEEAQARESLSKAKRMVEEMGYYRRDGEVAAIEEMLEAGAPGRVG